MADAPNASSATNTCDIWNVPEANVLLIVRIFGSVGHKQVVEPVNPTSSFDKCEQYRLLGLLLSHAALLRAQALIESSCDG